MDNRTREKAGLVIFVALVIFGGAVLMSYFATGLTWNVAATLVDDTVGRMEGYAAVVYSGVERTGDAAASEAPRIDTSDVAPAAYPAPADGDVMMVSDSIGLRTLSYFPDLAADRYEGVFVSDVRDLYEKKGARVATMDVTGAAAPNESMVINAGDKTIGVYAIDMYCTRARLNDIVDGLEAQGADDVVCLTPRADLLATYDGTDVVIATDDPDIPDHGTRIDDTLVVRPPAEGEAGIIFFSPNNVASVRVIDAL